MKRIGKIMQRLFVSLCLFLLFACGPIQDQAGSTVSLGNPDPLARVCASGFTRVQGNFCQKSTVPSSVALTLDNTCRSIDLVSVYTIPQVSRVNVGYAWSIVSANSVAVREVNTIFYTDSSCITQSNMPQFLARVYEQVALTAREIGVLQFYPFDLIVNTAGIVYYKGTACVGCTGFVALLAYYD